MAFLQWRLEFPNPLKHDPRELEELILARINRFVNSMLALKPAVLSKDTTKHSKIKKDFLTSERYDIIEDYKPYLISRFWTIGFDDPFPNDDKNIIGSVDDIPKDMETPCRVEDHVYPHSRYVKGNSPYCIYIPCKEIFLKLMRACIKVTSSD